MRNAHHLPAAAGAPPARPRRWVRSALAAVTLAALGLAAWRGLDHRRFWDGLRRIGPGSIAAVLAISLAHIGLRSLRFHWLVLRAGPSPAYRTRDGVRIFSIGLSASVVTPARAGDVVKSVLLRPYGLSTSAGLGVVAVERTLDLMVIAGSAAAFSLFVQAGPASRIWRAAAVMLLAGLTAAAWLLSNAPLRRRLAPWVQPAAARLRRCFRPGGWAWRDNGQRSRRKAPGAPLLEGGGAPPGEGTVVSAFLAAWDGVFGRWRILAGALTFSAVTWALEFGKLGLILAALGAPASPALVGFAYPVALISGAVSILPISEGVLGLTAVALLALLGGIDPALATVAIVVDRAASNLPPAVVGLLLSASPRARRELGAASEAPAP